MLLKEIELDLPYIKDEARITQIQLEAKLDYDEAIKKDYALNWREKRRIFQLQTKCMTSMIERLMPKITTKDCWKIIIECVENANQDEFKNLLGVYVVQVEFDFHYFCQLESEAKKVYVVSKITDSLNNLICLVDFNIDAIINTCIGIQEKKYINKWVAGKPVKNKCGYAQIQVSHEINEVILSILFMDLDMNIIKNVPFIVTLPDERSYSQYLGKLMWNSEREIVVVTKSYGNYYVSM